MYRLAAVIVGLALGNITVKNNGTLKGKAAVVDFTTNMTCTVDGVTATCSSSGGGPTGPTGPTGPQGDAGVAGAVGPTGPTYSLPVATSDTLGGIKGTGTSPECNAGQFMTGFSDTTGAMVCDTPLIALTASVLGAVKGCTGTGCVASPGLTCNTGYVASGFDTNGLLQCAAGGSGAPTTATYLTGTAEAGLSAEVNIGALTTGLMLNTVAGGVGTPSAYGGTSCTNQFPRSLNASGAATCESIATADLPTIDISKGGTTETASTEDAVLVGASTTDWVPKVLPSCSNATTSKLLYDNSTNAFSCGTDQTGGGGSAPPWAGVLHAARGDGDPIRWAAEMDMLAVAGPTPTGITTAVARCVTYRAATNITVNRVRLFGVGATTNIYQFAIYPSVAASARTWTSGTVTTVANTWLNISAALPITLTANTQYLWCVSANTTGTVAGFRSPGAPLGSTFYGALATPMGNRQLGLPAYVQFAVTAGAFPATLPTVAAAAFSGGTTGTVPFAFFDSVATP